MQSQHFNEFLLNQNIQTHIPRNNRMNQNRLVFFFLFELKFRIKKQTIYKVYMIYLIFIMIYVCFTLEFTPEKNSIQKNLTFTKILPFPWPNDPKSTQHIGTCKNGWQNGPTQPIHASFPKYFRIMDFTKINDKYLKNQICRLKL